MMANLQSGIREQAAAAEAPAPKAPRQKKPAPEQIEPESSSDSGSESSTYEEYEEVNKIKSYFESEPCESISPAALGQAKTTKEAVKYLQSKKCPKIANIKKSAKSIKMDGPPAPGPETSPVAATRKRVAKPKAATAPAAAPAPAPAPAAAPAPAPAPEAPVKKVRAKKAAPVAPAQGSPLAPAPAAPVPAAPAPAPAAKAKRPPSAYAKLVGELVKNKKMTFAEAAKAAKAQLDAAKKKD
jgi:hypothetical protein